MSEQRYQGQASCDEHGSFTFNTVCRKVSCPTCRKVVWRAPVDQAVAAGVEALFGRNPDHTEAGDMRRSIHRSHRGEGFNHVD